MNNLIANVNLNSQDVEEGQLPDDGYQQPAEAQNSRHIDMSDLQPECSSSEQIVLEVVQDQFYNGHKSKKIKKQNAPTKTYQYTYNKDKDKNMLEKQQKERKIQKNDKKPITNFAPEKEEINVNPNNNKNQGYPPASYYPPYMYPPHPMHMQMGQYPPMYQPYPYPMPYMHPNQNHYNPNMPMPSYPPNNNHPQLPQNNMQSNGQYRQYIPPPPPPPPPQQYPQYIPERMNENHYKMPPNPMNMYPYHHGYPGYPPMPYPPYDYYNRQRQAQQREQQQRASRKKEYIQELRNELKRNVKQFNGQESYEIVQTVKCILKFQDSKTYSSNSHSNNTETPLNSNDTIKESISQRCYERSLNKIEKWLQGDNPNVREFTKGLLQAMQMSEVILKIKQLKLNRKMQQQSLQSETKRLLDVLVRDPKKMIF